MSQAIRHAIGAVNHTRMYTSSDDDSLTTLQLIWVGSRRGDCDSIATVPCSNDPPLVNWQVAACAKHLPAKVRQSSFLRKKDWQREDVSNSWKPCTRHHARLTTVHTAYIEQQL